MLAISIKRNEETTLSRQIYEQLRSRILSGVLKPGEKLASSRDQALNLHVSRNVVLEAYDLLLAEGYVVSSPGSGTYVAEGAVFDQPEPKSHLKNPAKVTNPNELSPKKIIDFRSGIPALDLLPRKKFGQLYHQIIMDIPETYFSYDAPEGTMALREAICHYLIKNRGVQCSPEQMVITSGAVQGMSLISRLLLTADQPYILEYPLHQKIKELFEISGAELHFVPVDENGLRTQDLPKKINPALIVVTPSHQYPLGGLLPIQRRIELIQYARSKGSFILEDDYDSEFRYEGPPVSSLQGLDPEHVIYLGTFSKILFPALRLGYLILPPALLKRCKELKLYDDNHSHTFEQLALARFIGSGDLERHISKIRKTYRKRRDTLISRLKAGFPDVSISGHSTGLHLIAEFPGVRFDEALTAKLHHAGVQVYPVAIHTNEHEHRSKLIMGYSHLDPEAIKEGVGKLASALHPSDSSLQDSK